MLPDDGVIGAGAGMPVTSLRRRAGRGRSSSDSTSTAALDGKACAKSAGTIDLLSGLSVEAHWADMLSLGEQQRLGFARCLYRRPALVVLDEATSALPVDMERRCMSHLKAMGCGIVSVGHRVTLLGQHDRMILLRRDAGGVNIGF